MAPFRRCVSLQQPLLTAKAFKVFRGGPAACRWIVMIERNRVVEVADLRRPAASGEAAREVAATNRPFECGGRLIAQRLDRAGHRIGDEYACGGG